ncbi:MAG: FHA domain-containing protein, partial [Microbacterium sp.]
MLGQWRKTHHTASRSSRTLVPRTVSPVIIGRRPRSPRASGPELPTLIAVDSPQGDISRSHVEIKAEGEHVLVTDLATTNGTVLRRGGQEPVRLHPNEPTMVVTGDTIDLGDGVTATFEDLP